MYFNPCAFFRHEFAELRAQIHNLKETLMSALDQLKADVAAQATVNASAVTLLAGLKTSLDAAIAANAEGDDGAALAELSSSLEASTSALSAAITANTPASTETPATPVSDPAALTS